VSLIAKWLRIFWDFWWDFLVGDTPELFLTTVVIVVVAILMRPHSRVDIGILPVLAVGSLIASTYRGVKKSPDRRGDHNA
jgi:UDP:flavonoid glycosyltransferase YjiC (YdhE family)